MKALAGRKYLDAICVYFWATTPIIISIVTFGTYVLLGNHLSAAVVFTRCVRCYAEDVGNLMDGVMLICHLSISLFNMLIGPLNSFPWVINGLVEVSKSSHT